MPRVSAALLLLLVATGCDSALREVRLSLLTPEALGCRPSEISSLVLQPLGDFPADERPTVRLDLGMDVQAIERFPSDTELVSVTAVGIVRTGTDIEAWMGGGIAILAPSSEVLSVPLLRLRRSCSQSDTRVRALPGSVTLGLGDGRIFIAGGVDPMLGELSSVATFRPGDRLVTPHPEGLFVARVGATATRVDGGYVVVAGGSAAVGAGPLSNYDIVDAGETPGERPSPPSLAIGRREHGATRLPDGRVLLVGGYGSAGNTDPLASAEWLRVDEDGVGIRSVATRGSPLVGRARPSVFTLDDGTVLIVGGGDPSIERFDPSTEEFSETRRFDSVREAAAFASLAGGRVARVGGRISDSEWSRAVDVVVDRGTQIVTLEDAFEEVQEPVAVGLADGRLLVVGRDPISGGDRAQIVDPGETRDVREGLLEPLDASRVPTRLIELADGHVVELDPEGASLRRLDTETRFVGTSANIFVVQPTSLEELSIDAPGRWHADGDIYVADVNGARIDIPRARFAEASLSIETRGPLSVLLLRDGDTPIELGIGRTGACAIEVANDERVATSIVRIGSSVTMAVGSLSTTCELDLPARIGFAVRAPLGSGIHRISLERL